MQLSRRAQVAGFEGGREAVSVVRQGRWAFAGRESELQTIAGIADAQEARSVVIAGPAGVGKTRLAREALEAAEAAGRPTRWAAGTRAAGGIPLGAMAHLIPAADPGTGPLALLQHAVSALRDSDCARRLVIAIDDAHLLDEMSATLVHQIALSGTAVMVLTVRSGEPRPDPVSALWKDGLATRLDLAPLGRVEVDELLTTALGGAVDTRTVELVWRLTGGSALFFWELLDLGLETGSLRRGGGVWHWGGDVTPTPRLTEIVRAQLGELTSAERAALELLATAGPVGLELLDDPATRDAVTSLERCGLVRVKRDGRRAEAWVAQPLHAEVVRAQIPEGAARRLRRELVAAGAHAGCHDVVRAGRLLLESDEPDIDVDLLTDAAVTANARLQHDLAERFAAAAVAGGAAPVARLALLEAVHWQGRAIEAEQVAAVATPLVSSDDDIARLAVLRARNLHCGLGRAVDAEAVLRAAEAAATTEAMRGRLVGARGLLAFFTGRPARAIELGHAAEAMAGGDHRVRQVASAAMVGALAVTGRFGDALSAAEAGWSVIERQRPETDTSVTTLALAHGELLALGLAGRIHDVQARAGELHRRNLAHPEWAGDAVAALHMGWAALVAGRPRTAVRWLTEASAGLGRNDPCGLRSLCTAQLAQSHALLGDAPTAERLLAERRNQRPDHQVFEPANLIAEAWSATAGGRPSEATQLALRAASAAAGMQQWAVEAMALHTAVRMGLPPTAVARLRTLAGRVDGPLVAAFAEHAEAQAAAAGGRLDEVAAEFEQMGALLLAADATAHAAAAHTRDGDRRRAATSTAKGAELARACEGARTPALAELAPPRLTSREVEVADLARQGMHNRAIAERLVLSIRTVEAHLANTYTKLGITSRRQLRDALRLGAPESLSSSRAAKQRQPRTGCGSAGAPRTAELVAAAGGRHRQPTGPVR